VSASKEVYKKLFTAKEASDLHSSSLDQRILVNYLYDNDYDDHLNSLRNRYASQHRIMLEAIQIYFPNEVKVYPSNGGMFIWVELPEGISSVKLFYEAVKVKVVFVPGDPFYVNEQDTNTLRLSFANETPERILEGIKRLGNLIQQSI
jgi:2-aminoadipate transaminase